jgi:GH25 family lysozyme M1 (1,4-beta-N-acetylmuramidase)
MCPQSIIGSTTVLHGLDVSSHNDSLPWDTFSIVSQFVIVRATYGTTTDTSAAQHIADGRDAGVIVGAYHTFDPSLPIQDQIDAFNGALDTLAITDGDMIPAIRLAGTVQNPLDSNASDSAQQFADGIAATWADCLVGCSIRDFEAMGSPDWISSYSLWASHLPGVQIDGPATPGGMQYRIWSYTARRYVPGGWWVHPGLPGAISHDWALDPLPTIQPVPPPFQGHPRPRPRAATPASAPTLDVASSTIDWTSYDKSIAILGINS